MATTAPADAALAFPLAEVERALHAATRVAAPGPEFVVGICDDGGCMIRCVNIASFKQVSALARRLARHGFSTWIIGTPGEMQGCDILFARRAPGPDILDGL